jgi:transcriptional regulator with XRE-family HTH domain
MDPGRQRFARQFGTRVREVRHERGWTLEVLGEKSGLHYTFVGVIERGEASTSLYNAVRLAKALGVEVDELCNGLSP